MNRHGSSNYREHVEDQYNLMSEDQALSLALEMSLQIEDENDAKNVQDKPDSPSNKQFEKEFLDQLQSNEKELAHIDYSEFSNGVISDQDIDRRIEDQKFNGPRLIFRNKPEIINNEDPYSQNYDQPNPSKASKLLRELHEEREQRQRAGRLKLKVKYSMENPTDSVDRAMRNFLNSNRSDDSDDEEDKNWERHDRDIEYSGYRDQFHSPSNYQNSIRFRNDSFIQSDDHFQPHENIQNPHLGNVDIDNANYEELLELENRMGKVSKGYEQHEIDNIPIIELDENDEVASCPICIEDIKAGNQKYLIPCDHDFHVDCLKESLKSSKKCPVCQVDVICCI